MARIDEVWVGAGFGRLVIDRLYRARYKGKYIRLMADCSCFCGGRWSGIVEKLGKNIKFCGCLHIDSISTHGLSKNNKRLYRIWIDMLRRCMNPKRKAFKDYGGRGITVCEEWMDATVFWKWAESSGYDKTLTIDRIDVNGNYCPENCRWIPLAEQNRNRRNKKMITAWGETKSFWEWREDPRCEVKNRRLVARRIRKYDWKPEDAMTILPMNRLKK